jgi:purine nucleosidase
MCAGYEKGMVIKMKHILIDCDTGIDDSIAILYALKNKNIRVEGITTGFGNTSAKQAAENSMRLIKLANPGYEVPVAIGAEQPLSGEQEEPPVHIHGDNGIGNVELPESSQKVIEESAWDFILRKAEELNGELIIVTLGRLTNLAKALMIDPRLPYKVKSVIAMGGCLRKPGNISAYAEANIYGDAEASDMVVKAGFHMMLVGLDVTTETFLTGEDLTLLEKYCSKENLPVVKYIQSALQVYFKFYYDTMGCVDRCVLHDPLAMILAENPSLGEYRFIRARVEHEQEEFRGMIKIDERFVADYDHEEILFCSKVDADSAVRRILSVMK